MPDFSSEAYVSYVQLCRELRPDGGRINEGGQDGDRFYNENRQQVLVYDEKTWDQIAAWGESFIWLPTLADWLEMLEEAGQPDIGFLLLVSGWTAHESDKRYWPRGFPTREEATARLFMAVTDHV